MDRLFVFLKGVFLCYFIVTIFTTKFDSMNRLQMVLSRLIVTISTTLFDSIRDRLHMSLKVTFLSLLIVTVFTTKFDSIMDTHAIGVAYKERHLIPY